MGDQQRGDFPPTDQAVEVKTELATGLDMELQKLDKLLVQKLKVINEKGKKLGIQIMTDRVSKMGNP